MGQLRFRLATLLLLVLCAALGLTAFRSISSAERMLLPEVTLKAETLAGSLVALTERALGYGIPLGELEGVDVLFDRVLSENRDIAAVAILGPDGAPLYLRGEAGVLSPPDPAGGSPAAGTVMHPVRQDGRVVAQVAIALDPGFVQHLLQGIWIDLAIILVISALVALELVSLAFGARLYDSIDGFQQRLTGLRRGDLRLHPPVAGSGAIGDRVLSIDRALQALHARHAALRKAAAEAGNRLAEESLAVVERRFGIGASYPRAGSDAQAVRAPLFVFMFAEELTRPFLPGYIADVAGPLRWISPELAISLPITLFMVVVALSQPFLASWTERQGSGRSFCIGAVVAAAGFAGTAFAQGLVELMIFRAVTALGYATIFVAAQGRVLETTQGGQRARGLAVLVGAIMVAALCGPPIGGILADRLGPAAVFQVSAVLAAISLWLAWLKLPRGGGAGRRTEDAAPAASWRHLPRSPSFFALLFGCALPAKMILAALCFYLVPVHMQGSGFTQAEIGRVQMLYPVAMVFLVPIFSHMADALNARAAFVALGGLLGGLGATYAFFVGHDWVVVGILLQLGVAQAISIAPQAALVGELARRGKSGAGESAVYGIFRLIERAGNALGPAIAALLLGAYGFAVSAGAIGLLVMAGALVFLITFAAELGVAGLGLRTLKPTAGKRT